ncbi:unnamed protein product [Natator depressus]
MNLLLVFLFMLEAPSGVLSQVQLRETGPGAVKPGESLTLTCTISGDSVSSDSAAWHWVRQPAGKRPEWMGRTWYRSGRWHTEHPSSLQTRTTITPDTAKNQVSLQLRSLTAADTARYSCARQPHTHSDTEQSRDWYKKGKRIPPPPIKHHVNRKKMKKGGE